MSTCTEFQSFAGSVLPASCADHTNCPYDCPRYGPLGTAS